MDFSFYVYIDFKTPSCRLGWTAFGETLFEFEFRYRHGSSQLKHCKYEEIMILFVKDNNNNNAIVDCR